MSNSIFSSSLPESWLWQDLDSKIGRLLDPGGEVRFSYDASSKEVPAIKYQKDNQMVSYIFIGSIEEFKKYAESIILSKLESGSDAAENNKNTNTEQEVNS